VQPPQSPAVAVVANSVRLFATTKATEDSSTADKAAAASEAAAAETTTGRDASSAATDESEPTTASESANDDGAPKSDPPPSPPSSSPQLPDIKAMKLKELREELESYGISTKTFLEKSEFVEALTKARLEGKTPVQNKDKKEAEKKTAAGSGFGTQSSSKSTDSGAASSSSAGDSSKKSRKERMEEAAKKAKAMKVGELRKELQSMGVSTKSFFEKSEFVRAYAEAVADGKKAGGAGAGKKAAADDDEPRDPSYRDVAVQKIGRENVLLSKGKVIDIKLDK